MVETPTILEMFVLVLTSVVITIVSITIALHAYWSTLDHTAKHAELQWDRVQAEKKKPFIRGLRTMMGILCIISGATLVTLNIISGILH